MKKFFVLSAVSMRSLRLDYARDNAEFAAAGARLMCGFFHGGEIH